MAWPRLSETLTGPKSPFACQSCGSKENLTRWNECDDQDRPEPCAVTLCVPCSNRIIEPHPRLYRELMNDEPMPGAMPICEDCKARNGVRCGSPVAKFNGGPGLKWDPEPFHIHLCRAKRSTSGWKWLFPSQATKCNGKDAT